MKTERININEVNPNAYKPLYALHQQLKNSNLNDTEFYLIQIRASQINGCAYCIQMHVKEAIEHGEESFRIHALTAWDHSPFFTETERVILKMTEEVTVIHEQGLSQKTYEQAIALFGEEKVSDILMAIININAWNRIGVATMLEPVPMHA